MSFWDRFRTSRMKEMSPSEMAKTATTLLRQSGRNQMSHRLIYHALAVNPYEPEALIRLAEFYDDARERHKPDPLQTLGALILDYAVGTESQVPFEYRLILQKTRLKYVWAWGFSGDSVETEPTKVDQAGYMEAVSQAAAPYRNFANAFTSAHVLLGFKAEFLIPNPALGSGVPWNMNRPWEVTREKCVPTRTYSEWLNSRTTVLDRMRTS